VRWSEPWGLVDRARIEDAGTTLFTTLRVDREFMFAGLFYGVEGMRVGGTRRVRIAPQLAYREAGVPRVIASNALLTGEMGCVSQRADGRGRIAARGSSHIVNLVLVAAHAVYVAQDFLDPERDRNWLLQSFQRGEPSFYIEHIRAGIDVADRDPS